MVRSILFVRQEHTRFRAFSSRGLPNLDSDILRQKLGVSRRRQIPAAYRAATGHDPLATRLVVHTGRS